MYNAIICWKLKVTKSWWLMVTTGKSCEFLFLYCLVFIVGYELAAIFMSGDALSSVAFFMGELYMVWNN
jgi:hypothetical protein